MHRLQIGILIVVLAILVAGCATVLPLPVPVPVGDASSAAVERGATAEKAPAEEATPEEAAPADELPPGGSTPEEAVEAYMQGIIEGDLQAVFDAAARRDIARKYEFIRYVQRLRALPVYQALMPPNDDFSAELNEARSEAQIATQVTTFAWSLLARGLVNTSTGMTAPVDDQWAAEVEALMDMQRLEGIELTTIAPPDAEVMASERYQENAQSIADVYGADEYTEMVAHFTFEDQEYLVGFQLLRYGDSWYVLSQSSPLAGTPASGEAIEVDQVDE